MLDRLAVARKPAPRFVGEHISQTGLEIARMGTAAHTFAVGRVQQKFAARHALGFEQFGNAVMETLDRQRRRDLTYEAAGIRKPGLHGKPAAALDVVAVCLFVEQALNEPGSRLQTRGGFKERRNIDDVSDAEQLCKEHRDQNRRRALALCNQVTDRGFPVDMLADLRH